MDFISPLFWIFYKKPRSIHNKPAAFYMGVSLVPLLAWYQADYALQKTDGYLDSFLTGADF